jgi:hypothetical protein
MHLVSFYNVQAPKALNVLWPLLEIMKVTIKVQGLKHKKNITKMLVNCARRWLDIDIIMAKFDFSKQTKRIICT